MMVVLFVIGGGDKIERAYKGRGRRKQKEKSAIWRSTQLFYDAELSWTKDLNWSTAYNIVNYLDRINARDA